MQPLIGLMPLEDIQRESLWMLPGYMQGIEAAGGIPVMLPLTNDRQKLKSLFEICDGLLFTGGHDISPSLYGEERSEKCAELSPARDEMERYMFSLAYEHDKPIFGICRGIQLINALCGGTLYQDLPTQRPSKITHCQKPPYDRPAHFVRLEPNGTLAGLLKAGQIAVNSYHHQAIKTLAGNLTAQAYSEDGIVEAVTDESKRFLQAVQWHPEFNFKTDENSQSLFRAFVCAARAERKDNKNE